MSEGARCRPSAAVVLLGLDGAGKTRLAQLLASPRGAEKWSHRPSPTRVEINVQQNHADVLLFASAVHPTRLPAAEEGGDTGPPIVLLDTSGAPGHRALWWYALAEGGGRGSGEAGCAAAPHAGADAGLYTAAGSRQLPSPTCRVSVRWSQDDAQRGVRRALPHVPLVDAVIFVISGDDRLRAISAWAEFMRIANSTHVVAMKPLLLAVVRHEGGRGGSFGPGLRARDLLKAAEDFAPVSHLRWSVVDVDLSGTEPSCEGAQESAYRDLDEIATWMWNAAK